MKITVLEPQSADNLNMQIRLGIPHPVVSFAHYTIATKLRSPFSSSIAPLCHYWGLTQPTPLANLPAKREASGLFLTSLYLPHLVRFWILST